MDAVKRKEQKKAWATRLIFKLDADVFSHDARDGTAAVSFLDYRGGGS
jgi:hypothetical protein